MEWFGTVNQMVGHINKTMLDITAVNENISAFSKHSNGGLNLSMSGRAKVVCMCVYIVDATGVLRQARPSLWNMSSNVLNATGFTRL